MSIEWVALKNNGKVLCIERKRDGVLVENVSSYRKYYNRIVRDFYKFWFSMLNLLYASLPCCFMIIFFPGPYYKFFNRCLRQGFDPCGLGA